MHAELMILTCFSMLFHGLGEKGFFTRRLGLPNVIIVSAYASSHAFLTETKFSPQHLSLNKVLTVFPMPKSWALHAFLCLFMVEEKEIVL